MHNRLNYFSIDNPYSFQGTEKDNEVKGQGNSVNYKYRMHDPRVGRFFAIDPLASRYPFNGTYNFSENRVIDGVELEGLEFLKTGIYHLGPFEITIRRLEIVTKFNKIAVSWIGFNKKTVDDISTIPETEEKLCRKVDSQTLIQNTYLLDRVGIWDVIPVVRTNVFSSDKSIDLAFDFLEDPDHLKIVDLDSKIVLIDGDFTGPFNYSTIPGQKIEVTVTQGPMSFYESKITTSESVSVEREKIVSQGGTVLSHDINKTKNDEHSPAGILINSKVEKEKSESPCLCNEKAEIKDKK